MAEIVIAAFVLPVMILLWVGTAVVVKMFFDALRGE